MLRGGREPGLEVGKFGVTGSVGMGCGVVRSEPRQVVHNMKWFLDCIQDNAPVNEIMLK